MCFSPHPRQSAGDQKDLSSDLSEDVFACQMDPVTRPCGGRLLEGSVENTANRIHSLFTISNTRMPPHKEQGMRVSCTRGVLANRTADLFDFPDTPKPPGPMVEPDGIEPTTSCLQSTRSPN